MPTIRWDHIELVANALKVHYEASPPKSEFVATDAELALADLNRLVGVVERLLPASLRGFTAPDGHDRVLLIAELFVMLAAAAGVPYAAIEEAVRAQADGHRRGTAAMRGTD